MVARKLLKVLSCVLWAVATGAVGAAFAVDEETVVVQSQQGAIRGNVEGGVHIFRGIPYALPPVGHRRWKAPESVTPWTGEREALRFGAACVQPVSQTRSLYTVDIPEMSEDCLYLNVWAKQGATKAPVFVWIHGGALQGGAASFGMYDGTRIAQEGAIYVSINYRLGAFGYLAHPELSAENEFGVSGNYGLLDQIAALKWIRDNITAFGGDPENVTIAGESAGALSVMYLMATQQARGLFHKAIVQSGYMVSVPDLKKGVHGQYSAEAIGSWLMGKLGSKNLSEMRQVEAKDLVSTSVANGYFPILTVDNHYLTEQLVDTFEQGKQAAVPLIVGFNSGEIRSLRRLLPPRPESSSAYRSAISSRYGEMTDKFLELYPDENVDESMLAVTRDALYGWTSVKMAESHSASGVPAYLYYFDHGYPATDKADLHAFHASEIPYVLGTQRKMPNLWPEIPETAAEEKFAKDLLDYWVTFTSSGQPNATSGPLWQKYDVEGTYLHIGALPEVQTNLLPGMFDFHDETICRRRVAGTQPWHWNVGIASPNIPPQADQCRNTVR